MFQAIGKNIIAKAILPEQKNLILTSVEPKPTHYEVLSIGSEVKDIKVFDKLPYPQYAQQTFKDGDETYHVFSSENIYAKII